MGVFHGRPPISRKMSRPWNRELGWSLIICYEKCYGRLHNGIPEAPPLLAWSALTVVHLPRSAATSAATSDWLSMYLIHFSFYSLPSAQRQNIIYTQSTRRIRLQAGAEPRTHLSLDCQSIDDYKIFLSPTLTTLRTDWLIDWLIASWHVVRSLAPTTCDTARPGMSKTFL